MGAPVALAMGRYAWVGYRDRLPLLPARWRSGATAPVEPAVGAGDGGAVGADEEVPPSRRATDRAVPPPGPLVGPRG